jgi:type VI secretion system protein ImpH
MSDLTSLDYSSGLRPLQDEPHRFSLFAALRLMERVHADRPRLGESRRASEDAIRLAQPPYLTFVPTELAGLQTDEEEIPRLEEYSFGLFGPNGPLPLHFTEVAYERQRQLNDPTFSDFINFLQHRLITLFYRAWAESDPAASHDRPGTDRFKLYLGSILGLGFDASARRDAVLDHAKLSRAAQFGAQTRSAEGLEDVLAGYFELPIEVHSFAPAWLDIPPHSYTRLGDGSPNAQLGVGTTLGSASWQSQHQFEIVMGPLTLATFEHFLPGTAGLRELAALVRLYTNDEWSWILRLRLASHEVPAMQLGAGSRLGWTSWVGGRESTAEDVIIRGDACDA